MRSYGCMLPQCSTQRGPLACGVTGLMNSEDDEDNYIGVVAHFFNGINEPRVSSVDFSLDGQCFVSAHKDGALRLINVMKIRHTETINFDGFDAHCARFTQSNNVVCVAPQHGVDGHLYFVDLSNACVFSASGFLCDEIGDIPVCGNAPVYSAIVQSPHSDVIASVFSPQGRLLLFNPLISGALAASAERSIIGRTTAVSFSPDGRKLVVGDDQLVRLFDFRFMFNSAPVVLKNSQVFTQSGVAPRCQGAEVSADGSKLLLTSGAGEAVVYDLLDEKVVCSYFHGVAKNHFIGASDAVGAKYLYPFIDNSLVVQPVTNANGDRPLLVYNTPIDYKTIGSERGALLYELQCKDNGLPVAMAVNPRYALVANASRCVTLWSLAI
ncbi:hypothetical protein TRVL_05679 [Trypanosoma vivax]|nr:hypothetical protein TRVL_05679 [Trypanosoma vivax]